MAETTNYGLYLEDDSTTKFQEWREKMNGTVDSNMVKIDTALASKAAKSISVSTVLSATAWAGVDNPFTQEIAVPGLGADQLCIVGLADSATAEQREAARIAALAATGQSEGAMTIAADGEMPDIDLPVLVILLG